MVTKLILQPGQLEELVPHWPEFNPEKLARISTRNTRYVHLNGHSDPKNKFGVLDVPGIVICPAHTIKEKDLILNGKHRAAIGILRKIPLLAIRITTAHDIQHCLAAQSFGQLTREELEEFFAARAKYEDYCRNRGINNMRDLINREREKIAAVMPIAA